MKIYGNKGMTTLEMCFILPVSFILIYFSLWTAFFYYNQTVFSRATEAAVLEGSRYSNLSNAEITDKVLTAIKEETDGKLIFMGSPEVNVSVNLTVVSATAKGSFDMSYIFFDKSLMDEAKYNISVTHEAARLKPSDYVRSLQAGKKLISEISE